MSLDGTKLLLEGFLQKRKDTMKIRWVTYWFRLQNTTLFFYTQKNGSASHLRGHYYIYTVQSVRDVQRVDNKRFMFEIIMNSGKRKLLAAETAALRQQWVGSLWQAMNLSTSLLSDSRRLQLKVCEQQRERLNSSAPLCSLSDRVMESLPPRPLSAPDPTGFTHQHPPTTSSTTSPSEEEENQEENPYQMPRPVLSYQHHNGDGPQWSAGLRDAEEGDYDILPLRNKVCEINESPETDEGVYDVPLSYRRTHQHHNPTESVYDVPSSLMMRMIPDHTREEQQDDGVYWAL
ncbi:uncharacterized protein LOC131983433 [Centropristis striata]|uniref:uncharacterized protein LOC131983433 n=1 Tax=Centropristis striata TaxID=184440 RepID=UPI0027E1EABF|nr:uncharacterized protein LOC131983433 [Centropristis striata]